MLTTLGNGKSGLTAQMQRMDINGNNIANISTTGYKRQSVEFAELLRRRMAARGIPVVENASSQPTRGSGINASNPTRHFDQGNLQRTGRNLDLAINGKGFFRVTGADGNSFYTRDGNFYVDANGRITDSRGNTLIPEELPENYSNLTVDLAGNVTCRDEDDYLINIGQIELAVFPNPAGLNAVGENLFLPTGESGEPQNLIPGLEGSGTVQQGYLENSNVDLAAEMQSLIEAQRSFQLNAKSITIADQLWNITNNLQK